MWTDRQNHQESKLIVSSVRFQDTSMHENRWV